MDACTATGIVGTAVLVPAVIIIARVRTDTRSRRIVYLAGVMGLAIFIVGASRGC